MSQKNTTTNNNLPKIKNYIYYIYGCLAKLFCFLFFGTGSIFLALVVFPIERIFIHPKIRFQKVARATVSFTFRFFIGLIKCLGIMSTKNEYKNKFRNLKSKIIVANHPSILDVVFLISLIPNADCIVRGSLANSIYAGVIRQLYIVNSLGYEQMIFLCKKSIENGNCLIVFPEGTRTPRNKLGQYKKGAARMAIDTKSDIVPVYIGGSDKYGLGKHDPFFSFSRVGKYKYNIYLLPEIKIADYDKYEAQIAAKRLTQKIHDVLADVALEVDNRVL